MITDDERREVARRLREYVDLPDDWWADTYSGFYVEKCAFGNVERHRESELFARLADLIEPSCDRDELLEEVKELEKCAWYFGLDFDEDEPLRDRLKEASEDLAGSARRIREALGVRERGRRASEEDGGDMVSEAIRELTQARREVGVALDALAGGGRVEDAAPACARAVEGLCAVLSELAWSACDRASYGEGGDE